MSGKRRKTGRGRGAQALATPFRARAVALVAALALVVQLLTLSYHQARAADAYAPDAAVAAALKAAFGDAAALCVESDGKGAPAPAGVCDDHCPLCRFASQSFSIVAPDDPALPVRLGGPSLTRGAAPERGAVPLLVSQPNRARAPPLAV